LKFRPFSTQIGHNSACTSARAAEFAPNRGLSGTANLMLLFRFSLQFSHKICRNSACINTRAADFTANRGFLGTAELMLPFKFFLGRPLFPWLQKLGYFRKKMGHNSAYTNATAAEFAPNSWFSETADVGLMVPFKFSMDRSSLPW